MKLSELQEVLDFAEQFSDKFNMEQKELVLEILTENEKPVEEKPAKKKAKIKKRKHKKRISNVIIKKAIKLKKIGISYSEISKATGIPQGSLNHILKQAGAI